MQHCYVSVAGSGWDGRIVYVRIMVMFLEVARLEIIIL